MSAPAEDFRDLGCGDCGGEVDEDYRCIDCGYCPLDDEYDPAEHDDWLDEDEGDLVDLGPTGKAALG